MAGKEEKKEGKAPPPPAPASSSSDDDDDAGEVQIDAAQADRLMALERELESDGAAQYDTHVEVRRRRRRALCVVRNPRARSGALFVSVH